MMKYYLAGAVIAVVALADFSVAVAAPVRANHLIGRWKLSSGPRGCNEAMAFSAHHQDQTSHGLTSGAAVTGYVVNGKSIIVGGVPGQMETFHYDIIDASTIASSPGPLGRCVYKRS